MIYRDRIRIHAADFAGYDLTNIIPQVEEGIAEQGEVLTTRTRGGITTIEYEVVASDLWDMHERVSDLLTTVAWAVHGYPSPDKRKVVN